MLRSANGLLAAGLLAPILFLAGCAGGASTTATVDTSRPPPPSEPPPAAPEVQPEPPPRDSAAEPPAVPALTPGYVPAVQIGARVAEVRTEPAEIVLEVGDSLAMGEDVETVAYDAAGSPVLGVRILANIDSRFAVLEEGHIKGVAEGEAELRMAIQVPPASGTGPPEIRTFSALLTVVGHPVVAVEIVDPGVRFFTGGLVPLEARALTGDGGVRRRVEVVWTSNRRRQATVDERGFVTLLRPGAVTITATVDDEIEGTYSFEVEENPVAAVTVAGPSRGRTGDVLRYSVDARDAGGGVVEGVPVDYAVASFETRADMGASVYPDGAFVAERPGLYRVTASVAGRTGQTLVEVVERGMEHEVVVTGRGLVADHPTSDLWAFTGNDGRDYVYTGTHLGGQRMLAWDVTNPANPVLTDFVEVDARVVNDVKVNRDATVAVITREGASDRKNGIVVLDLTDPGHPVIADTYTKDLSGGVHNVFFAGDILYAIHNGTLDVHHPRHLRPERRGGGGALGHRQAGQVPARHLGRGRTGLRLLLERRRVHPRCGRLPLGRHAHRAGRGEQLRVRRGQHARRPSRTRTPTGTPTSSSATRSSTARTASRATDIRATGRAASCTCWTWRTRRNPREVARYEVPEAGAHNLWIEDDRMYVAYYQAGLRVVDVSGELRGDLYRQGREIAWFPTGTPDGHVVNSPMAWGPQPFKGHVYVSDLNSGLWGREGGAEEEGAGVVRRGARLWAWCAGALPALALLPGPGALAQSPVYRVYVANESSDLISRVAFTPGEGAVVENQITVGIMAR